MNKNRDLKHNIYALKRLFGQLATIHKRTVGEVDYISGEQVVASRDMTIARVILLPVNYSMQRNFAMFLAAFKYGGDIKVGDREVIIDRSDLQDTVVAGDYIVISEKRFEIISILEMDDAGYYLAIRNTQDE